MSHLVFPILWALAMLIILMRARPLLAARPASRSDHIGRRLKRMAIDGLGQRKFLSGEQPAGIMHAAPNRARAPVD